MTRFACKLADLVFILSARYSTAERYCREYIVPSAKGIAISYSDEDMRREREKTGMPPPLCELSLLYREICRKLLFHDGMVFHASVVAVANRAYGFTAPSGTGKSTHAAQWRLKFEAAAVMVNDDKPLLRFVGGEFRAYGTPWCGKEGLQTPVSAPLRGIAVLERAAANRIERVSASAALPAILNQTLRPEGAEEMDRLLTLCDRLVRTVPLYRLSCLPNRAAADLAYETMRFGG